MKIASWNVNGLRARLKYGFEGAVKSLDPDIICLQEVRAKPEQLPASLLPDYEKYFSLHAKPGYAGSAIFVHKRIAQPFLVTDDFPHGDETGRVCIADFKRFKLISSYTPNSGGNLEKLEHRTEWEEKLCAYIGEQLKPVILCGDLNVAPLKIDNNTNNKAGTSFAERNAFQNILNLGFTDTWRSLHPGVQEYSWFSNMANSRERNKGMRLDHFVMNDQLFTQAIGCDIVHDPDIVCKSDHDPIVLTINIEED